MKYLSSGGQRLVMPLLILFCVAPIRAQSPQDTAFLSTLGEMREASYSDKAKIAERLSQTGHSSVRAVLTALLESRLYFRNSDQKDFYRQDRRRGSLQISRSPHTEGCRIRFRG